MCFTLDHEVDVIQTVCLYIMINSFQFHSDFTFRVCVQKACIIYLHNHFSLHPQPLAFSGFGSWVALQNNTKIFLTSILQFKMRNPMCKENLSRDSDLQHKQKNG